MFSMIIEDEEYFTKITLKILFAGKYIKINVELHLSKNQKIFLLQLCLPKCTFYFIITFRVLLNRDDQLLLPKFLKILTLFKTISWKHRDSLHMSISVSIVHFCMLLPNIQCTLHQICCAAMLLEKLHSPSFTGTSAHYIGLSFYYSDLHPSPFIYKPAALLFLYHTLLCFDFALTSTYAKRYTS